MQYKIRLVFLISLVLTLSACDFIESEKPVKAVVIDTTIRHANTNRWYTLAQQEKGLEVFSKNCAACHGDKAQETIAWKVRTASGHYPPPPLNGSAHAWHHPLTTLKTVIREGGEPLGGVMPAWQGILSEDEITSAIAAFQSYWSDEIYQRWLDIDQQSRQ